MFVYKFLYILVDKVSIATLIRLFLNFALFVRLKKIFRRNMREPFSKAKEREQSLEERQLEAIRKDLEEILKDKIERFPIARLKSPLPNVASINIGPKPDIKNQLNVSINWLDTKAPKDKQERSLAWTIWQQGDKVTLSAGNIPPFLGEKIKHYGERGVPPKIQIAKEIKKLVEIYGDDTFLLTDPILPETDPISEEKLIKMSEDEKRISDQKLNDPDRDKFLKQQEQFLFGFTGRREGLVGYSGFVFPNFIILENPQKGNAVFILDFKEILGEEKTITEIFGLPNKKIRDTLVREQILDRFWKPIGELAKTKKQIRDLGAIRIVHIPKNWKLILQDEINSRKV